MSWITVIWSAVAGICLTLATVHLMVWARTRDDWVYFFFAIAATAAAACSASELAMMHVQTPEQFGEALRWLHLPLAVMVVALVWFIRLYLQTGRLWLAWLFTGLRGLTLALTFSLHPNLNFSEITGLKQLFVWGETVVIGAIGEKNPLTNITHVSGLLLVFFVLDSVFAAWRQGNRQRAVMVGGSFACAVAVGLLMSELMNRGILPVPFSVSFLFLIVAVGVSYQLSYDLLRANQLSQELEESHNHMTLAANAANLGLWEWDTNRNTFWINEASRARLGTGESERTTLKRFLESLHPDDREPTRRTVYQALEGSRDFKAEYRMVTPEGAIRWIAESGQVVRSPNGKPLFMRGVTVDITERKQAEKALEENEKRLKEAQRIAHIGSWELDLPTNTLTWSDEIFRIFEIDKERFGASYEFFLSTVHPQDREAVNTAYTQSLKTHEPYAIIHRLLMPDGRVKYVHEQCETFYSPEGKPLRSVGTVQDITQEKHAESERIQLRNDLAHAQRVSTMGHISSALAHELNQPLGAILNNASAAQILGSKPDGGNTELEEIIADIISDARRAGQVVRKIRGIVKKTEVKFEQLNVNVLIEEVVALYRNVFNMEKISSSLDLQPDLSSVRGDRIHLQQVFMNLINNASEAMRESPLKALKIRSTLQSPDLIIVSVVDSGTGIDEAKKEKVFDQFFTTKRDGLGMGLGICRSIVEEHGGSIWVENNPAGGATFSFSLKAYRGDSG